MRKPATTHDDNGKVVVIHSGIVSCVACSPFGAKKTERIVNTINATGISSQWTVIRKKPSGCPCESDKKRRH